MTHDNKLHKPNPRQSRADRKARYTLNIPQPYDTTDRGYDGDIQYSIHAGITRDELGLLGQPKPIAGGPVVKCLQWEPTRAKDQT